MTPLSESAAAHFRLAGELAEEAQKMNHTPQKNRQARSSLYYRRALAEYKRAADLAPTDFDVLNNFAYLAWQWELDAKLFQKLPARPQDEDLQTAEKYAMEAIRVSLWRQNPSQKAMAEDTLGEVLVAEGRNQTAIGFLRLALTANARSYGLDEVRWDLAQALTCDARSGSKNAAQEITEAKQLFDTIANSEALREYRPFTSTADSLDLHAASNRCFAPTAPENN
jgi:tetratricopeptide (TPR) repeat protein